MTRNSKRIPWRWAIVAVSVLVNAAFWIFFMSRATGPAVPVPSGYFVDLIVIGAILFLFVIMIAVTTPPMLVAPKWSLPIGLFQALMPFAVGFGYSLMLHFDSDTSGNIPFGVVFTFGALILIVLPTYIYMRHREGRNALLLDRNPSIDQDVGTVQPGVWPPPPEIPRENLIAEERGVE